MSQRQTTHSAPKPKKPQASADATDFARPDVQRTAQGAPPHKDAEQDGLRTSARDREHGYAQDAGYQTSGGYRGSEATGAPRESTEVSDRSRTSFDADDEDERPETD